MALKANKDIELLVRVPLLVAWGNSCIRPARVELLAGSFIMITIAVHWPFTRKGFMHHELGNNLRFIQTDEAAITGPIIPVEVYEITEADFKHFQSLRRKEGYEFKKVQLNSGIVAYVTHYTK